MQRRLLPQGNSGGVVVEERFVIQVKTDNTGTSANNQVTIPTSTGPDRKHWGFNYHIFNGRNL